MNRLALIITVLAFVLNPKFGNSQSKSFNTQKLEIAQITNSSNRSSFHLIADTTNVRGNTNQAYSDCGSCDGRFHVIAANYFDKNIAWTLISAPGTYYNCGTPYFIDSHNCIDGDCTFHMHNVSPGEYVIAAKDLDNPDSSNTIVSDTITIQIRAVNNGSVTTYTNNLLCNGDSTGNINIQSTLAGPISFNWSNGNTTSSLNNLMAGSYSVTVVDANKCKLNEVITIGEPSALYVQPTFINNLIPGPWVGQIQLNISGATPPYQFLWSNGATTQDIAKLGAGSYVVTITDANNCVENRMYRLDVDSIQSTGISDLSNNQLVNAYPNPFNDIIQLEINSDNLQKIDIQIINILGKEVYSIYGMSTSSIVNKVDLSELENGIYFLKLTGNRLNKTVRLIKQ
ncbi:MAG: T9SS type A sorting domain-containing protein [Bacteroidia bacterium]|nr:T9SS type A sorting domain-containing protein [Bacteroidia bacterium]